MKGLFSLSFLFFFPLVLLATSVDDIVERSHTILEQNKSQQPPNWLRQQPSDVHQQEAKKLQKEASDLTLEEIAKQTQQHNIAVESASTTPTILAFASFSMPEAELKALMQSMSGANGVIVFKGLRPGDYNFTQTVTALTKLSAKIDPPPNIQFDPFEFRTHSIDLVPTLLWTDNKKTVSVRGLMNPEWLQARIDKAELDGKLLGTYGPTYPVKERDMVHEMQERISQYDWNSKIAQLHERTKRYWSRYNQFIDLPLAPKDRTHYVDLSIRLTNDLTTHDGKLIAHRGEIINPLERIGFSKVMIVFDGMNKKQVEFAKQQGNLVKQSSRGIIYITTLLDKARGWEHHDELEATLQAPVYLLKADVHERFGLEYVPSVVYAQDNRVVIVETKISGQ